MCGRLSASDDDIICPVITSRNNRWAKAIRRAASGGSRRPGPILLEGPHLVGEALRAELDLEAVVATSEFLANPHVDARSLLHALPFPPLEIDDSILAEITDSDSPRGIVALGHRSPLPIEALPRVDAGVYVYADGVQDPGNLGALARTAEAAGAAALFAGPGCPRLHHPRALRASAGSLLRLPAAENVSLDAADAFLASLSPVWTGLVPREGRSLWEMDGDAPETETRVLVVGAEGPGLSAPAAERLDARLTIPMAGETESLNATVSAAIVLFEWARRRALNPRERSAP